MELFLIRHAAAVDVGLPDAERGLTPHGRADFEASVRGPRRLEFRKRMVAWLRGEPRRGGMDLGGFFPADVTRSLGGGS